MNNYLWNENVFIRSMGSQGNLGGLNNKAQDVGDVLAASGKETLDKLWVMFGQPTWEESFQEDGAPDNHNRFGMEVK